jgi:hypothetical protein
LQCPDDNANNVARRRLRRVDALRASILQNREPVGAKVTASNSRAVGLYFFNEGKRSARSHRKKANASKEKRHHVIVRN